MAKIYSVNSALSPENIDAEMFREKEPVAPWVRIGDLYTSVSFTGNESWRDVVEELHNKGQKDFVIMTGRHGDQLGQQTNREGKFVPRPPKPRNGPWRDSQIDPAGDEETAKGLRIKYPEVNIQVMDVGNGSCNSTDLLKTAIWNHLSQDRVVMLAWCYSLYAMKPGWYRSDPNRREDTIAANKVPICRTASDWGWALRRTTSKASTEIAKAPVKN
jgi:hypothetical protein